MTHLYYWNHKKTMRACRDTWANRVPAERRKLLDECRVVVLGGKLILVTRGKKSSLVLQD
jgi:hypothetical protein